MQIVQFTIPLNYFESGTNVGNWHTVVCNSFNMSRKELADTLAEIKYSRGPAVHLAIKCRPEQFVAFLISRNASGLGNGYKELNVRMYEEERRSVGILDVADRRLPS